MKLPALSAGLLALAGLLPVSGGAAPVGIVTIAEGDLAIVRDAQRFAAAEGLRVREDDILRTSHDTRLARVELADGSALDLGPDTELLLQPRAGGELGERAATLYLARGWLKVSTPASLEGIASPVVDLRLLNGSAVLRVTDDGAFAFVESGRARIAAANGTREATPLAEGDSAVRRGRAPLETSRRLAPELRQGLPRGFADALPRRAARFQARPVEPSGGVPVSHAEVATWIDGEPALRALAVQRFASRAGDRQFRAALLAGARSHPEWERVLFPEKSRPRPAVVVQRAEARPVQLHGLMSWPLPDLDATEATP